MVDVWSLPRSEMFEMFVDVGNRYLFLSSSDLGMA